NRIGALRRLQIPPFPESEGHSGLIRPRRPFVSWLHRFVLRPAENVHTPRERVRSWGLVRERVCTAAPIQTNSSRRALVSGRGRNESPRARDQLPPPLSRPPWPAAEFLSERCFPPEDSRGQYRRLTSRRMPAHSSSPFRWPA